MPWMIELLERESVRLKRRVKVVRLVAYALVTGGVVLCAGWYFLLATSDPEKLLSLGPGLAGTSTSVVPFKNVSNLSRRLNLISGLLKVYHENKDMSEEEQAHFTELVMEALKTSL